MDLPNQCITHRRGGDRCIYYPSGHSLQMGWKTWLLVGVVVIVVEAAYYATKVSSRLPRHFFFFADDDVVL